MDDKKKKQEENSIEMKKKVSVRSLVEFILREGDITKGEGSMDSDAMQAGSRLHRKIQKRGGSQYEAEVPLKEILEFEGILLTIEGRADGIITKHHKGKKTTYMVDEIKTMYRDIYAYEAPENVHLAQAKCYGYMYAKQKKLSKIEIQITYANLETEECKRFVESHTFQELEKWFFDVINQYKKFLLFEKMHHIDRTQSAKKLEFPFSYRKGQRDMAGMVYTALKREENLLVQAPTGIGKTMSAIFPAIKAMGEGMGEKLFYLTAKTITRTVAQESLQLLVDKGLLFSFLTISAKEKICPLEQMECNPEHCPYAKGHYDRINDAIYDMLIQEIAMSRRVIEEYSNKHQVCPFEFSLDAALFADGIICDYNYLFDPRVYLKRFFSENSKEEFLFLIDEAHNLVDRGRSMYSAQLAKEEFLLCSKLLKTVYPKGAKAFRKMNKAMLEYRSLFLVDEKYVLLTECDAFVILLMRAMTELEEFFSKRVEIPEKEQLLEVYFHIRHFINMYEFLDENYMIYLYQENNQLLFRLFCVNPSANISRILEKGRGAVLFSATLLPIAYYKDLLLGSQEEKAIYLPSPFAEKNRFLGIMPQLTTKYSQRGIVQYERMVEAIKEVTLVEKGNYMVFFSSYQMMEQVYDIGLARGLDKGRTLLLQRQNMSEQDRENFLLEFQESRKDTLVAFCILGGIFSEGIDLSGERLIGSIIVGTGLPQVCVEQELLKQYFHQQGKDGFAYAYTYPGMNKVLQAAGRVIRKSSDKGVMLLLDGRFQNQEYRKLFPREWSDCKQLQIKEIKEELTKFWNQQE